MAWPYLFAMLTAALPMAASAAVTLVWEMTEPGEPKTEAKVIIEADRLRIESADGAIVFRGDRKVLWMIDDAEKSYIEMDPQRNRAMTQQLQAAQSQAMQQMQDQMRAMAPAEREQMQQMLARQGMGGVGAAPPKIEFRKLAGGKTVGRWRCDEWEQLADGKRETVFCWARLGELGLSPADVRPMTALQTEVGFAEFGAAAGGTASDLAATAKAVGSEGLPVRSVDYSSDGQPGEETVLKSVARGSVPAALFELPAGYRKEEFDMPGAR